MKPGKLDESILLSRTNSQSAFPNENENSHRKALFPFRGGVESCNRTLSFQSHSLLPKKARPLLQKKTCAITKRAYLCRKAAKLPNTSNSQPDYPLV